MGGVFFPVNKGILCGKIMERNYRGSSSRGIIFCVTNGCQLRSRGPKVRCLSGLGAHTNLDWARRVCVYFGVGITIAVIKRRFIDSRQADQASAEPRGTVPGAACPWVPVSGSVLAETSGSEAWEGGHGRIIGPV